MDLKQLINQLFLSDLSNPCQINSNKAKTTLKLHKNNCHLVKIGTFWLKHCGLKTWFIAKSNLVIRLVPIGCPNSETSPEFYQIIIFSIK